MKLCDYEDLINRNVIFSNNPSSIIKVSNIFYEKIKEGSIDEEINKEIIINGNNITIQATTSIFNY